MGYGGYYLKTSTILSNAWTHHGRFFQIDAPLSKSSDAHSNTFSA
jgi:hypothetical protein